MVVHGLRFDDGLGLWLVWVGLDLDTWPCMNMLWPSRAKIAWTDTNLYLFPWVSIKHSLGCYKLSLGLFIFGGSYLFWMLLSGWAMVRRSVDSGMVYILLRIIILLLLLAGLVIPCTALFVPYRDWFTVWEGRAITSHGGEIRWFAFILVPYAILYMIVKYCTFVTLMILLSSLFSFDAYIICYLYIVPYQILGSYPSFGA